MKRLLTALVFPFKVAVASIGAFYLWLIITALWMKHCKDRASDYQPPFFGVNLWEKKEKTG